MVMQKLISQSQAVSIRKRCRRHGKKVVFTNGCFDLIHRGHVEYLAGAKRLGDMLIIGLNTDSSVARLKGRGRPIMKFKDRAFILSHLDMVDYIVPFGSLTPKSLIRKLSPDILVKGGDYKPDNIVGAFDVRQAGGRVVVVPLLKGRSTSKIVNFIKNH
jgi:rfaE bifunctional protein nucleotidyltransferase chain/domain